MIRLSIPQAPNGIGARTIVAVKFVRVNVRVVVRDETKPQVGGKAPRVSE